MMIFIFIAVVARSLNSPILGDVELVELSLVILIMFGLSYTETENAHISIGLIVDRLPERMQLIPEILSNLLITSVSWFFAWIFYNAALKEMLGTVIKSDLLSIPEYPFKLIIAIGTFLWGLVSLFKLIKTIIRLFKGDAEKNNSAEAGNELWQ